MNLNEQYYDPDALLTGEEVAQGLSYSDKRVWCCKTHEEDARHGRIPHVDIPKYGPRKKTKVKSPS